MTTSIPLADLQGHTDRWRRDQHGRYLVVPPTGGKPVGYTRVTTVAKTLDDGGALGPWKAAMCATGMVLRKGLRSHWEALIAEHGDVWYSGQEVKKEAKALIEECAQAGGANDAREWGSSLHTMTALIDVGRPPKHLHEDTERDLEAYVRGMKEANVQVVPGAVELTVVLDAYQVAGTFDRLVTVPGFDLPLIADIKTGINLEYSWQSTAVQLAGYAHGDAIYEQGTDKKGTLDQRHPMPAVDQEFGVIIWLQAGQAHMELWLVDLQKGWEAFEHSLWTREWRKYDPAAPFTTVPITANPGNSGVLFRQSLAAAPGPVPDVAGRDITPQTVIQAQADLDQQREAGPLATFLAGKPDEPPRLLRDWLQGRIDTIGEHKDARKDLIASWPDATPPLREGAEHTDEQLALIEQMLTHIEARYGIAFPPPRPTPEEQEAAATAVVLDLFPGAEAVANTPTNEQDNT